MKVYSITENKLGRIRLFWLYIKDLNLDLTRMDEVDLRTNERYFDASAPLIELSACSTIPMGLPLIYPLLKAFGAFGNEP